LPANVYCDSLASVNMLASFRATEVSQRFYPFPACAEADV
jgi:hypothetical protein